MVRKALIRTADGFVENVIEINEVSTWPIPAGRFLLASRVAGPGDTWNGTRFIPGTPPAPSRISVLQDKLRADTITTAELRELLRLSLL